MSVKAQLLDLGWGASAAAGIEKALAGHMVLVPASRWTRFHDWASSRDSLSTTELTNQVRFLDHELRNGFAGLGTRLDAAASEDEAAGIFAEYLSI